MKRALTAGVLGLLLVVQSGCIAISAKEVKAGTRMEAVAVNGRIYVVDKQTRKAREVKVVNDEQCEGE